MLQGDKQGRDKQRLGLTYTPPHTKQINTLVMAFMGKESLKSEHMLCIRITHFAVHLKLTAL